MITKLIDLPEVKKMEQRVTSLNDFLYFKKDRTSCSEIN